LQDAAAERTETGDQPMTMSVTQWLAVAAVVLGLWLIGRTNIDVHELGWFTGLLLVISVAFVVVIMFTERIKEEEAGE
jgi:uncharacterized membrane protein YozB (DUF420 family)